MKSVKWPYKIMYLKKKGKEKKLFFRLVNCDG